MANRVLLNASNLRVSKPGWDVATAPKSQLQFSSDFSALALFTQGAFGLPWNVAGNIGRCAFFVPFGKTFPSPPIVLFYMNKGAFWVPVGSFYGLCYNVVDGSLPGQTRSFIIVAQVTTSGIQVNAFYNKQTSGWPQPNPSLYYYVLEYNL